MRTIRVELQHRIDATSSIKVSTEVVIGDDQEADDAGREARAALDAFISGYVQEDGL